MRKYKILTLSDNEILKRFSVEQLKEKFKDVDFILSAGDVSNEYLDYLFTALNKELIYVNGNHVYAKNHDISFLKCIDGKIINYAGLRILGLDGCLLYNHAEHQYTEGQMKIRILKNIIGLLIRKPDIILTHAPPRGIHDKEDLPHKGFEVFIKLIKYLKPKLWIHGHVHLYSHFNAQETISGNTRIINTFGYRIIEFEV